MSPHLAKLFSQDQAKAWLSASCQHVILLLLSPDMAFDMALNIRAFECAIALGEFADRLTVDQRIAVELALIAGPDRAPLGMIALAAQNLGERI